MLHIESTTLQFNLNNDELVRAVLAYIRTSGKTFPHKSHMSMWSSYDNSGGLQVSVKFDLKEEYV